MTNLFVVSEEAKIHCGYGNLKQKLSNGWIITQEFEWGLDNEYRPVIFSKCKYLFDLEIQDENYNSYTEELTDEEVQALEWECLKDEEDLCAYVAEDESYKKAVIEQKEHDKNPYAYYGIYGKDV